MEPDDRDALNRQAAAWLVRLRSGEATTQDRDAFLRWRGRSEAHEQALREAARLWDAVGHAVPERAPKLVSRRIFLGGAAATASAAGASLALGALGVIPTLDAALADHATAIGERRSITLPDGTVAALDGASSLTLHYSGDARLVRLTAGAAVFEVARHPGLPFVVEADDGATSTHDGMFSIRHDAQTVTVDCLGGRASVRCRAVAELRAGEGIVYSGAGLHETHLSRPEAVAAWRNGLMIFRDQPLADVVADLNRHRMGKVILAGNDLGARRVSGVFHLDRPEEIVAHLKDTLGLNGMALPGGIVLLR